MLGLICFVAGTYTVLTAEKSAEHGHQVDIHPPGIDPIKPMAVQDSNQKPAAIHDPLRKDNSTSVHVKDGPVDMDVAKVIFLCCLRQKPCFCNFGHFLKNYLNQYLLEQYKL